MPERKSAKKAKPRRAANGRFRPVCRAIKPGSRAEYWYNHPEELDAQLRSYGIDPDEIDRVVAQGGGKLDFGDFAKKDQSWETAPRGCSGPEAPE